MPQNSSYHLRRMAASDADAVQRLWSHRFGGDESTQSKWIEAALRPTHSAVGLVAIARSTRTLIGLSFLDVGDAAYTRRYLGLDTLPLRFPLADRNGIFHLSCVHADWEGRGIGSTFYQQRLATLADRDVPRAVGIAWHRSHSADSRRLFEKFDFTAAATVNRYYTRVGERPHCPDCDDVCTCTASLYARRMSSD